MNPTCLSYHAQLCTVVHGHLASTGLSLGLVALVAIVLMVLGLGFRSFSR